MKPSTVQQLDSINRSFYDSEAARGFSDAREHFWPGWDRVVSAPMDFNTHLVLDVGCGNGRFADYLCTRWHDRFQYVGIDRSERLLAIARARVPEARSIRFIQSDLFELNAPSQMLAGPFTLIVAFGVMHHLPSLAKRAASLKALLARLQPGGHLAVTFWRFGLFERFRRKIVDWKEYNLYAAEPVESDDLESGDVLLRWGKSDRLYRYCHFTSESEIETLISLSEANCTDMYTSDGEDNELNRYVVLSK